MDDDQRLRDLFVLAAELPSAQLSPPANLLAHARRRRLRFRSLSSAAAAVALVAAVVLPAVALGGKSSHTGRSAASLGPPVSPPNRANLSQATATALGKDQWAQLPAAPIGARSGAAAVWDGREMLEWGGVAGQQLLANGAGYDPMSRTWTVLPASPLSARTSSAFLWTGQFLEGVRVSV